MLAYQTLLHDARGGESVTVEKLSQAISLAKPVVFIRHFVNLGPQMADLLKHFIKQNVAVEYIKRILDAFKEDDYRIMQCESDQLTTQAPSLSTQPLVDPLANRELDVLALLAQRLRNMEIAAKLFISPETVKSMKMEDKTLLGSHTVNSKNPSYRTLRGVGSTSRRPIGFKAICVLYAQCLKHGPWPFWTPEILSVPYHTMFN